MNWPLVGCRSWVRRSTAISISLFPPEPLKFERVTRGRNRSDCGWARGVAEVKVVGEAHPRWGQTVVAYIVPPRNSCDRRAFDRR